MISDIKNKISMLIILTSTLFFHQASTMTYAKLNKEAQARVQKEMQDNINFAQGAAGIFNGDANLGEAFKFLEKHQDKVEAVVKGAAELGGHAINGVKHVLRSQEKKIEADIEQIDLELSRDWNKPSAERRKTLNTKKARLEKRLNKLTEENTNIIGEMAKASATTGQKVISDFANERIHRKDRESQRLYNVLSTKEKAQAKWNILTSKETVKNYSIGIAGVLATVTGLYYGGKLSYNYLDAKIGKPTLVRESNRLSAMNLFLNLFKRNKIIPAFSIDEVILEPKAQTTLYNFADEIKNTYENGLPFRHVLFYGLPGTGKTMFARAMAQHCGLDYAMMSGADFSQFKKGEGIVELHKLFDWAKNSKKGLLVFIDEADSFLRDRRVLSNEEKNLLNAFLSRTGANDEKVIFVFATNYENELDPAVLSRIHKKIEFALPEQDERIKILNLYLEKYIANDEREIVKENKKIKMFIEIPEDVNSDFINQVAKEISGFSGRDIEQLMSELRISAYNQGDGILSKELINNAVQEKIKEHKHDMQASKMQKQRYEKELGIA